MKTPDHVKNGRHVPNMLRNFPSPSVSHACRRANFAALRHTDAMSRSYASSERRFRDSVSFFSPGSIRAFTSLSSVDDAFQKSR